ncbi:hypothetical protein GOBAR_DD03474 [Gossypium barbadense]|nr:hypothetical protein GOBAR_DD03474 [Gossypium barbadense]
MGKRKSRAKPAPKKRMDKLDTVFSCPFCNHGTSVECRLDMKNLIGEASCRICQESFSTVITALTEPIDIYSEWIDECERVNNLEEEDDGDQDEADRFHVYPKFYIYPKFYRTTKTKLRWKRKRGESDNYFGLVTTKVAVETAMIVVGI